MFSTAADDASLLNLLLAMKPSPLRRKTLLEALEISRDEVPQSLLLAWLLGPQGPTTDYWLLREILHLAAPSMPWPGTPRSVLPEVEVDSERPDIVAEWDSFKLIIEYKVDSPEGRDQVSRYLDTFEITSPQVGMAVYLTPVGSWPKSVAEPDPRVLAISFSQLIDCIRSEQLDQREPSERGRAMLAEYRDCLHRVLNRSINVENPIISAATKVLCAHREHFDRLIAAANQESADFMESLAARAETVLRADLGPGMVTSVYPAWGYFTFRKKKWTTSGLEYGIAYGCEGKLGSRAMDEYEHCTCIRVQPIERGARVKGQKLIAEAVYHAIKDHFPFEDEGSNQWFAGYHAVKFDANKDWEDWADKVIFELLRIAQSVALPLDRFAASGKGI